MTHVYCCAECNKVVTGAIAPKIEGCHKGSFHRWINIGIEGTEKYKCNKCKVMVNTIKLPTNYGCSTAIFHKWKRL
jgi:phage FluMu protein Com